MLDVQMNINPEGIEKSLDELEKKLSKVFSGKAFNKMDISAKNTAVKLNDVVSKLKQVTQQMHELENAKIPTEEYEELCKGADDARAQLIKLQKQMSAIREAGRNNPSGQGKKSAALQEQIDAAEQNREALQAEYAEADKYYQQLIELQSLMQKHGKEGSESFQKVRAQIDATLPRLTELRTQLSANKDQLTAMQEAQASGRGDQFVALQDQYKETEGDLRSLIDAQREMEQEGSAFDLGSETEEYQKLGTAQRNLYNTVVTLQQKLPMTGNVFMNIAKSAQLAGKALLTIGGAAARGAVNGLKAITSGAIKAGKALMNVASAKIRGLFAKLGQSAKSAGSKMGKAFSVKNLALLAVGLRSVMAAFNKIRGYVVEGVKNIAQLNNGNNQTNQSLSMLSSSLAQLKNSLGAAAAPILNALAPALNTLIQLLTQATTALGMFFAKLSGQSTFTKAVAVQKDYAKSLDKSGKSANKALASFDQLNNIQSNSGGGGGSDTSPDQMFKEVPIDADVTGWLDKFKEAWENADFSYIGNILGTALRDALQMVPWDTVKGLASKIAKSLATFINGFLETEGLADTIGQTLAQAFNTVWTFLHDFVTTLHWDSIGKFIADSLTSFVTTVDWTVVSETISSGINGIFTTLQSFADNYNPTDVSSRLSGAINTTFEDIDWAAAGKSVSDSLIDIFQTAIQLVEEIDWQALGNDVATFISNIDWGSLASSLFEGIGAALGGLTAFLWGLIEGAWNSVVEWWHENAIEDGKFSIEGLFLGILEVLGNLGMWIREHIFQPFIDGFKKAFGIASPSKVMNEEGGFIMEGLKEGIANKIKIVIEKFNDLKNRIKEKLTQIKTTITAIFTNIKVFVSNTLQNIKSTIVTITTSIWNTIKRPLNAMLAGIETVCNGIINGINKAIDALNSLSFAVPDWVPVIGGKSFGLNITKLNTVSLPRLAEGAVIPPNKEFLAVLGDQKNGTNIETPLDTMVQAFTTAMESLGMTGTQEIVLQLDGREFMRAMVNQNNQYKKQTGGISAFI